MNRLIIVLLLFFLFVAMPINASERFFQFQSIDTMKMSRDTARSKADDTSFDDEIDLEMRNIADTGATHVGIGTPYDVEFLPFLRRWVIGARRYNLKVWFRGNFAGWEGWFGYSKINRAQHLQKISEFIHKNPDLFENGDIFTPCPECENGGPGDPRMKGDVNGHREFLINEYEITKQAFKDLKKVVYAGFFSMNGDVARLIMDPETTARTGGYVVVDHYVRTPEQLANDVKDFASRSEGKVILGEFGSPIPDIHGDQTDDQQAQWVEEALQRLLDTKVLHGLNYWVNKGGSTAIWEDNNTPHKAVGLLTGIYTPSTFNGKIQDSFEKPLANVIIESPYSIERSGKDGLFIMPVKGRMTVNISKEGYRPTTFDVDESMDKKSVTITLEPVQYNLIDQLKLFLKRIFK